jgi:carbonic anhydrase
LNGNKIDKQIQSNKLRLLFTRRPCSDLSKVECQEPDPPSADFPNGWGGFADAMHVDIKVPAEHLLNGHRFDAEMQIYHLHPGRRRMPTQSVLIKATDDGYNSYFDAALTAFEYEYDNNRHQCAQKRRRERRLVSDFHDIMGSEVTSEFDDYTTWGEYSTEMDRPGYEEHASEMERKLEVMIWDPHHAMLIPTIHFYRYEGSITEPPCGEFVSWFVADVPMVISKGQLERLKTVLFTHVDPGCRRTSVHFNQSVARPIQETAGRPVYRCTRDDFGPDVY